MPKPDTYQLISSAAFRSMVKRHAKPDDLAHVAIFKAGGLDLRAKAEAPDSREVHFVLSTSAKDRENDTIQAKGWSLAQYQRNPVVLAFHDHSSLPVARASNVRIEGDALKAVDTFTPKEINPAGDVMLKMIRAGYLNACSVGFAPGEHTDNAYGGIDFTKGHELLEHSIVAVPAHQDALVEAKSKGIDVAPYAQYIERLLDMERSGVTADVTIRRQLERLRAQADGRGRSVFVALSKLKLPGQAPAADDAARAEFLAIQQTLAACGTNLSAASEAIFDLLNASEPVGGDAADGEATDIANLTTIAENCAAASGALATVAAQAAASGGTAPKSQGRQLSKSARREVFQKLLLACATMARREKEGRRHSAADQQMVQHVHDLAGQLGAVATPSCAPAAEAPKDFLPLDDDEVDFERVGLKDRDVADIIGRVIAEQLMLVTGRVL